MDIISYVLAKKSGGSGLSAAEIAEIQEAVGKIDELDENYGDLEEALNTILGEDGIVDEILGE